MHQILVGSQIPFGRLDRSVPEQQLNLFHFAGGRPAQGRREVGGWRYVAWVRGAFNRACKKSIGTSRRAAAAR
jgi:hypothetical protein